MPAVSAEAVRALPKLDLHCHLDGAARTATLLELAREARRFVTERARGARPAPEQPSANIAPSRHVDPFAVPTKPSESELAGSDASTLPQVEPESAGPFV